MEKVNKYKNSCWFTARVEKAFVDTDNKKHIIATASDNLVDRTLEYFTEKALNSMVTCTKQRRAKKPDEGKVRFIDNHYATFSLGYAIDGILEYSDDRSVCTFKADIVLKDNIPAAMELFDEVMAGTVEIQLSVGGYIPNYKENTDWEEYEFTDKDSGAIVTEWVFKIDDFILDHIACTPLEMAANPRTGVEAAKSGGFISQIYKSLHDNMDNEEIFSNNSQITLGGLKSVFVDALKSVFVKSKEEDTMPKEEATSLVSKLKEMNLEEEKLKELGIMFVKMEDGDTMDVNKSIEALTAKVDAIAPFDEERVKALVQESLIGEERIKSIIQEMLVSEDRIKAIVTEMVVSEEKMKSTVDSVISEKFAGVEDRFVAVEKAAGISQNGTTVPPTEPNTGSEDEENVWG